MWSVAARWCARFVCRGLLGVATLYPGALEKLAMLLLGHTLAPLLDDRTHANLADRIPSRKISRAGRGFRLLAVYPTTVRPIARQAQRPSGTVNE